MFRNLSNDISYVLRLLRRTPAFAVTTVPTLALGIGATTAIFPCSIAWCCGRFRFPTQSG